MAKFIEKWTFYSTQSHQWKWDRSSMTDAILTVLWELNSLQSIGFLERVNVGEFAETLQNIITLWLNNFTHLFLHSFIRENYIYVFSSLCAVWFYFIQISANIKELLTFVFYTKTLQSVFKWSIFWVETRIYHNFIVRVWGGKFKNTLFIFIKSARARKPHTLPPLSLLKHTHDTIIFITFWKLLWFIHNRHIFSRLLFNFLKYNMLFTVCSHFQFTTRYYYFLFPIHGVYNSYMLYPYLDSWLEIGAGWVVELFIMLFECTDLPRKIDG